MSSHILPYEEELLELLDLEASDIARLRAAHIVEEDELIRIEARIGAGNKSHYSGVYDLLRDHEYYEYDKEHSGDRTYVDFYFDVPDSMYEQAKEIVDEPFN